MDRILIVAFPGDLDEYLAEISDIPYRQGEQQLIGVSASYGVSLAEEPSYPCRTSHLRNPTSNLS